MSTEPATGAGVSSNLKLTSVDDDLTPVRVATDGSVRRRQLGCGYLSDVGGWGVHAWPVQPRSHAHAPLHAELHAMERAERRHHHDVTFLSDCQPAVDLVRAWLAGELRPVPGYTGTRLVRFAHRLAVRDQPLRVEWVRGHAGHPLNEGADALARLASRALADGLDRDEVYRRAVGLAQAFARQAVA